MLHTCTKFQKNPPAGSGEDNEVYHIPQTKLRFPYPRKLHIKFAKRFLRCLKMWTEDKTTDQWYSISSPMRLWLRLAKNLSQLFL